MPRKKKVVEQPKIEKEVRKFTPKQKQTFINFSALAVAFNENPFDLLIEAMDDIVKKYLEMDRQKTVNEYCQNDAKVCMEASKKIRK